MFLHLIDRNTARAFGLKRFFTGVPCRRGGVAQRYTGNGTCMCGKCLEVKAAHHLAYRTGPAREKLLRAKREDHAANRATYNARRRAERRNNPEAVRAADKARRDKNPESTRAKQRAAYAKHREKRNAENREAHRRNREARRAKQAEYVKQNPHTFQARNARRRALQLERQPKWFGELDDFAMKEAALLRRARKQATQIDWEVDHMVPLRCTKASGLHCAHNLQVIPAYLNQAKNNRLWLAEPGQWLSAIASAGA